MSLQTRVGMPMEEFIRLYDEAPFELVKGERILLVPPVAIHILIIKRLMAILLVYEQQSQAGQFFSESTFVLLDTPNWVTGSRVPDIAFYSAERWAEYISTMTDWQDKPFVLVPDLCIEVISQNDNYTDVEDKVAEYLRDGVRMVWVINPRAKSVAVYVASSEQITRLTESSTLTGGDVLPNFSVPVRDIFPE
jgi:Uma2 family endonuclease